MSPAAGVEVVETRWRGEPALTLRAGAVAAIFLPHLGMTGVSLRAGRDEFLATPGGPAALRAGHTLGLPLLAPWANRLATRRFRVASVDIDLRRQRLHTDGRGLPIHGLLIGAPGWRVLGSRAHGSRASLRSAIDVDASGFPFPHRIELAVTVRDPYLEVTTTVVPTARRRVPVAFGWHPYLRLPGGRRSTWDLHLPRRTHLLLDDRGIPTGARVGEPAEAAPIARRQFDDLYALGRDRRLAIDALGGAGVELRGDAGYPNAQVWVPPGRPFVALEPMVAPTNALVDGPVPTVAPGDAFRARFRISVRAGGRAGPR